MDDLYRNARRLAMKGFTLEQAEGNTRRKAERLAFDILDEVTVEGLTAVSTCVTCLSPKKRVIGSVFLDVMENIHGMDTVFIRALAVDETRRGRGVGSFLLWAACRYVDHGVVYGACSERAAGFYTGRGFSLSPTGGELALLLGELPVSLSSTFDRWFFRII